MAEQDVFPEDFSVITITLDGEAEPSVDLGDVSPHAAITIFELVAESLKDLLMPPKVRYNNRMILDYGFGYAFDEDVMDDGIDWDEDDDSPEDS